MDAQELATTAVAEVARGEVGPKRRDSFAGLDVGIFMMARGARSYAGFAPAEWLLLLVLAAWSVLPIAHLVMHLHGGTLTGADGPFPADQLQYLAWIRDSGTHVLAGDLFEIPPGARVFLHPMWLISGILWRAGLPIWLAGFIWKPVAVLVPILGVRAYVARLLDGHRTVIVALALCYVSPLVIVYPAAARLAGEMFTAGQLWGYLPSVIAVGLMPVYVLALERAVRDGRALPRGPLITAAGVGLLVGWLHPWEGETLALITIGLLWWARGRARVTMLVCLAAVALPLAGYFALAHLDAAWRVADAGGNISRPPFPELLAALGPLLAVAIAGIRRPGPEIQERALLLWPAASLLSYFLLAPSSSAGHALAGIAIPLAVLADRGVRRALGRLKASTLSPAYRSSVGLVTTIALVFVLTVPGAIHVARSLLRTIGDGASGQVMSQSDRAALRFLAGRPGTGGVLAPAPLSAIVPAFSGKPTWVGHPLWTPDFARRAATAQAIAGGRLPAAAARRAVLLTGAAYVLAGCGSQNLGRVLAPIVSASVRFGCDTVYVVR